MDTRVLIPTSELIKRANKRVNLPHQPVIYADYDGEVDSLYLKYSQNKPVISDSEDDKGIIYDLDKNGNIVGIEILDLYGIYAAA